MCGFVGAYGPNAFKYTALIHHANRSIKHRGPDGDNVYQSQDGFCVLAHVRLSILDLTDAAAQPMQKAHDVLTYNGEIYNHLFLRKPLEQKWQFTSTSDTETILAGLSLEGVDFLEKMSGMFAGAYYHEETKQLVVFRDPLGIKPLYFANLADSTLIFASEIKALLNIDKTLSGKINVKSMQCYLAYENYPQSNTLFENIHSFLPGEVHCYQPTLIPRKFINKLKTTVKVNLSSQDLITKTRYIIEQSVKNHLLSDVPIGVYLSGGLDSSIVACMAARHAKDLSSFTGYFTDTDSYYDERKYSRIVAQHIGTQLNEVEITPNDFTTHFDKIIYALGQPRMGMGGFSQYMVAKMAGQNRKVFLAGHGGDELFAGYPIFKAAWLMQNKWVSKSCWPVLRNASKKELPWIAYMFFMAMQKKAALAPLIFKQTNLGHQDNHLLDTFISRSNEPLEDIQRYYQDTYLPGLLLIEDSLSMAHSLETRLPLWNPELIEWANSIHMKDKMPSGQLKGLLRQVAKGVIPDELLTAPKRGFPTPLRKWFRNPLESFIKERLLSESIVLDTILTQKQREQLLNSHLKYPLPFALDERRSHRIWMLLCIESWSRQYQVSI